MKNKPVICIAQPTDKHFGWQVHLYIESCMQIGFDEIHVLMYAPKSKNRNAYIWDRIQSFYPNVKFFFYEDDSVKDHIRTYIPILRPHCLKQHFKAFPHLSQRTVVYTDCDILWVDGLDIEKYFDDDVCYISNAKSYMNVSYFERKIKEVLPDKLDEYKKRDVVKELCAIVGIDKQIVVDNNDNTGGVQYILKGIDYRFWEKVTNDVILIKKHLANMNKKFFPSERKGFQSWCADLWAVLYNLWYFKKDVKVVKELDFAWVHDNISKLEKVKIYHNAGATKEYSMHGDKKYPVFYKGRYRSGRSPMSDPHLDDVLNHEESKRHCTWYYASKLDELRKKYKLI